MGCATRFGLHLPLLPIRRDSSVSGHYSFRRKQCLPTPVDSTASYSQKVPCLATQADLQWFLALPPKIQLAYFSGNERHQLIGTYHGTEILDAADRALCRLQQTPRFPSSSQAFSWEGMATPVFPHPAPDTPSLDDSDEMDDSLYNSFRWLDEDGELDLSLDEYRGPVSSSTSNLPSRQRPSFRRTLSLNSVGIGRKLPSSIPSQRAPSSSQSSTIPPGLINIACRNSISRPSSRQQQPYHAPRSSTSSVDPSAQYYQDPDARLKLRVYLASPQKFDEAVEFGFPSLRASENSGPQPSPRGLKIKHTKFMGTFLEDDSASIASSEKEESSPNLHRLSYRMNDSLGPEDVVLRDNKRESQIRSTKPISYRPPGNREMTLKMTLTRPDLRADSAPSSPEANPLKLYDLPRESIGIEPWVMDKGEHGLMKKMWRKIRGQPV